MGRLFCSLIFLLAFLLFQTTSFSQAFTLLKDINQGPLFDNPRPLNLTEAGGSLFFTISKGSAGGFWKSDGSDGGTTKIKALSDVEAIEAFVKVNDGFFFIIFNSNTATSELWKSDGTPVGTVIVNSWECKQPIAYQL